MTALVTPRPELYDGWVACVADFGGAHVDGSGHEGPVEVSPAAFGELVVDRLTQADPAWQPPVGRVPCSYRWITDDPGSTEVVGFLAIRHTLNEFLLEQGGHVGYSVRPSRRREGHASRALAAALPLCARLGIDRVLLTCDEDNVASRRTIESNGGAYEDSRHGRRRYWIASDRGGG